MQRLSRLDGLRGILAVYVMAGHALPFTAMPYWLASPFRHGEAAVDLFFALSGLVIVNSLERCGERFWPFMQNRARRLLPVYFSVLALAVVVICIGSPLVAMPWISPTSYAGLLWALPPQLLWHILAHVMLLHGLVPQGVLPWAWITILGPAWSLSTEWQFYVLMALLLPCMKGSRRLTHFAYLMLGMGVCYRGFSPLLPAYWQFSRAFLPDAAPYFALGLASAVWLRSRDPIPYLICLISVFALGLVSGMPSRAFISVGWTVLLLAQRNPRMKVLPKLLDSRAAQYLGVISYPLYLINEPLQRACAMLIAPFAHGSPQLFTLLWLPVALSVPVLAAMLLHKWIEAPAMKAGGVKIPALPWRSKPRRVAHPGLPQPPTL
jgi:peptidoglycan/LPS O-acetylase OafA/YrhL